ncbi:hypothetical protein K502DRAFT_184258 [Neoconidiobolus thromboides FSU 785]|nr:hypothetical protein K502DRAFT_184258 [Neoconidiobolus thromboides FSU 785]
MNFLYNTFVAPEIPEEQSGANTIYKLRDRLELETASTDRRSTVQALKALSNDYKELVGEQCLNLLTALFIEEKDDTTLVNYYLETFENLFNVEKVGDKEDLGYIFGAQFAKNNGALNKLFECLSSSDFYLRYNGIRVVQLLKSSASGYVQSGLLTNPLALASIVDLLDDEREIIRNEGLLVLIALTESNMEIQKIMAFQNVFEKVLDTIEMENGIDGGIIVQDCLFLILNLLNDNLSNQNFFRESSYIPRLLKLLIPLTEQFSPNDWQDPQRVNNILKLSDLIRVLTKPNATHTKDNQNALVRSGFLDILIQIITLPVLPRILHAHFLFCVGNIIRDNRNNQDKFISITLKNEESLHHEPFIIHLVSLAVEDDVDDIVRIGATFAFQVD